MITESYISKPDLDDICFRSNKGEWSDNTLLAFQRHLAKLDKLNKMHAHLNGSKINRIKREERFWYSINAR